ncbi:MAG: RDD family protein [Arenimonas sp.]
MTAAERASAYPAHLGWRLLAITYDALPLIAIFFFTSIVLLVLHGGNAAKPGTAWSYLNTLVYWSIVGCYAVASWRRGGQTMGMRPWRLLVVNRDGQNASVKALCLRYAIVSLSGGLALLWCLFDSHKRGLHDLAAGTLIVRKQASASVGTGKSSRPSA